MAEDTNSWFDCSVLAQDAVYDYHQGGAIAGGLAVGALMALTPELAPEEANPVVIRGVFEVAGAAGIGEKLNPWLVPVDTAACETVISADHGLHSLLDHAQSWFNIPSAPMDTPLTSPDLVSNSPSNSWWDFSGSSETTLHTDAWNTTPLWGGSEPHSSIWDSPSNSSWNDGSAFSSHSFHSGGWDTNSLWGDDSGSHSHSYDAFDSHSSSTDHESHNGHHDAGVHDGSGIV